MLRPPPLPMKNLLRLLLASLLLSTAVFLRAEDKAATPDVAGTWQIEIQTANGPGHPVFTFKQDGEKLTGRYKGLLGEADVTGTLKGDAIAFSFKSTPQGQEIVCTYTGTVNGDTMKGTAKFGDFGDGPFTGKKQAAK